MAAFRRFLALTFVVAIAVSTAFLSNVADAATADDLAVAKDQLAGARAQAQAAAADFASAEAKVADTENKIAELEDTIGRQKARAADLKTVAQQRALYAYTHKDEKTDILVGTDDAVKAIRQTQWIDRANETDNTAIRKLASINADLKEQQGELESVQKQQQVVASQLDAKNKTLQGALADVQAKTNALQQKYDAEIAKAEADKKAQLAAEQAALLASTPRSGGGAGQIVNSPVVNGFACPVRGAAYTDDYGGPTGHPGIDMFVPIGTPVIAVKAGSVSYVPNEGAGGNAIYLNANDGNTYYYAHQSSFAGGNRSVSQGEILGYSGMSGNASAPHVHFEIRIGGPNGGRIDPFPTLKSAGC
jgi:murein DD-endopeptidase MepM/ murein hydrolase activator NlpD